MRRVLGWAVLATLALAAVAYLARDAVVRRAVSAGVTRRTGFPLEIGAVGVGLLGGTFDARDVRLENPPGWPERRFVDLPLLRVEYDTLSLLRRRPHVRELVIRVSEVHVVTDARGVKNTELLSRRAAADAEGAAAHGDRVPFRVDLLRVHVGTVYVDDYSRGRHAQRRIVLDVDATYRHVTETSSLPDLVASAVLGQLGPVAGDVTRTLGRSIEGIGGGVERSGKGLLDVFRKRR